MQNTLKYLRDTLTPKFGVGETRDLIRALFHKLKGWNSTDLVVNMDRELNPYTRQRLDEMVKRLMADEPVQYITGEAYFYGMDLNVNPDVLIPRVETQELVDMIVKRYGQTPDLRVLDIGTGSGAIAIALARNLKFADVTAIEISEKALEVARDNGRRLKARVRWIHADVFSYTAAGSSLDIVVSNPPYIASSEMADMNPNVTEHEPWGALFVPDDDPLRYYTRISGLAAEALRPGGTLWLEINPRFAEETVETVRRAGFTDVETERDLAGRIRFVSASKPDER